MIHRPRISVDPSLKCLEDNMLLSPGEITSIRRSVEALRLGPVKKPRI